MREDFRVLIIDDDPDDRTLASRELRKGLPDARVTPIGTRDELADALRTGEFDVVVTDYHLGWTDGITVLRSVKTLWPDRPVVIFTGTGSEEIAVEAMKAGVDDYVLKSPRHYGRLPAAVLSAASKIRNRVFQRALSQISQALITELDLNKTVAVVMEEGINALSVDAVALWLVDGFRPNLILVAHQGISSAMMEELRTIPFDAEMLVARASVTRQMQVIEDIARDELPSRSRLLMEEESMASIIAVPLISHGRLVGAFTTFARTPRSYPSEDLTFLNTVSSLFAVALENARLFTELRQSVKLREEFMASAAHELRTPLTTIKGWNDLLLRYDYADPKTQKGLQVIHTQVQRISQLLEDLLAVDRLRGGTGPLKLNREELVALMSEVAAVSGPDIPGHAINVVGPGPVDVLADRALISEVIRRLLHNAAKYSPPGSSIDVGIARLKAEARLSVHDHGVGISPERQPHVFEPFYEPVPSGKAGYVGRVSLGLYLSKQIIEAHGGQLWFTSVPDQGSTFCFTLPLIATIPDSGSGP